MYCTYGNALGPSFVWVTNIEPQHLCFPLTSWLLVKNFESILSLRPSAFRLVSAARTELILLYEMNMALCCIRSRTAFPS